MTIKDSPLIYTYKRAEMTFVSGSGCVLKDADGKEYLDCLAGIAVTSLGHANPEIAKVIAEQAAKLVHVSNLYWTEPMAELAAKLNEITGWGKVFFTNSGAESNECAIKLARKWAGEGRYKILCADKSFHGRTLGTLAATGQPAKWKGFEPLPEGFVHLPFNDLEAFTAAVDGQTAAIMVEPIQGEGGLHPATAEFLEGLRKLCDDKNIALIFDEVQSGIGRTGSWWAFQNFGVEPDIFTSAKALGNGLPIGACIAKDSFAESFVPGDHGTTYGGGPVVCAAALEGIKIIERDGLLQATKEKGAIFKESLLALDEVEDVRGQGLMLGAKLSKENSGDVAAKCLEKGLIVNAVAPDTIRWVPPLIISESEISQAVSIFKEALTEVNS